MNSRHVESGWTSSSKIFQPKPLRYVPHFLLGYGIEDPESGIHGDEEYLYVVALPSHGPFTCEGDWTVRVSEHNGFPRWDGPTEDAFERATWQYEGTLSEAIEELVAESA